MHKMLKCMTCKIPIDPLDSLIFSNYLKHYNIIPYGVLIITIFL